jgi:hypothetical protein
LSNFFDIFDYHDTLSFLNYIFLKMVSFSLRSLAVAALCAPLALSAPANITALDARDSLVAGNTLHASQHQAASVAAVAGGLKNAAYFVNW